MKECSCNVWKKGNNLEIFEHVFTFFKTLTSRDVEVIYLCHFIKSILAKHTNNMKHQTHIPGDAILMDHFVCGYYSFNVVLRALNLFCVRGPKSSSCPLELIHALAASLGSLRKTVQWPDYDRGCSSNMSTVNPWYWRMQISCYPPPSSLADTIIYLFVGAMGIHNLRRERCPFIIFF